MRTISSAYFTILLFSVRTSRNVLGLGRERARVHPPESHRHYIQALRAHFVLKPAKAILGTTYVSLKPNRIILMIASFSPFEFALPL